MDRISLQDVTVRRPSGFTALFLICAIVVGTQSLDNQCGIQFCESCNPETNFCFECNPPYKPGYDNQTICIRCANNCATCYKPGNDSSGRCLSCEPNFDYQADQFCDTFEPWVYYVVVPSYSVFGIAVLAVLCYIKRQKDRQNDHRDRKLNQD